MTAAASVEKRVDTLRRAAGKARDLATVATPGPWSAQGGAVLYGNTSLFESQDGDGWGLADLGDAIHIASWHPEIARAAADMFEEFARLDDQGIHPPTSVVTLAKRYLGEAS